MLDLDMRQLEYFVAAATAGSYSQTAKQLFVSPQAISKGVQVLEGHLRISLFERGPNGIALTPFGETFYKESRTILKSLERLQNIAEQYLREYTASLSVGIHSLCFKEHGGSIDWNKLLEFHEGDKKIAPNFLEMRGDSIIASVDSGALDFGITVPPSKGFDSFEGSLLKSFPLAALVSSNNEYFEKRTSITIEELTHWQLVLFSEEREFNNFFVERAQKENLSVDVSSLQVGTDSDTDFVVSKNLYTIRPYQHAVRTVRGDNVRILPILDNTEQQIEMPLYIFWEKGKELTAPEKAFVTMISGLYH